MGEIPPVRSRRERKKRGRRKRRYISGNLGEWTWEKTGPRRVISAGTKMGAWSRGRSGGKKGVSS